MRATLRNPDGKGNGFVMATAHFWPDDYEALCRIAREQGVGLSTVIRSLVHDSLTDLPGGEPAPGGKDGSDE